MDLVKIVIQLENKQLPFFPIGDTALIRILGITKDQKEIDITSNCKIISLDSNFIECNNNLVFFKKEGTAIIKAFYTVSNLILEDSKEFVCYNNFFRDNYLKHFLSSFDSQKIKENKKLKIILDSIMTFFDILFAYKSDIESIKNINLIKSKYLDYLSRNFGFERNLNSFNANEIDIYDSLYKELLKNIIEIIKLRGTKASYELFFGALGYDIIIEEFWWDSDSNLIQIDDFALEDEVFESFTPLAGRKKSTFYAYTTDGILKDGVEKEHLDPRRFASPLNSVFKNSKSNYIRPLLFPNSSNIVQNLGSLSSNKRKAIFDYLEFLRPGYIQYLPLIVAYSIQNDFIDDLIEDLAYVFFYHFKIQNDFIDDLIEDLNKGKIFNIFHFVDSTSLFYDSEINYDSGLKYDSYTLLKENFFFEKV